MRKGEARVRVKTASGEHEAGGLPFIGSGCEAWRGSQGWPTEPQAQRAAWIGLLRLGPMGLVGSTRRERKVGVRIGAGSG